MVGIPKKAFKKSELSFQKRIGGGSHQVWFVTYVDKINGIVQEGFFKELEPQKNFPELLAKISVAMSVILSSFQDRTAQEHLVFNDKGVLVGILSVALKDFKPFNIKGDPQPVDRIEKEQVIPSNETLVRANMMEILFGRWFLNDDDPHPRNLSLNGGIDYDMFAYWFVIFMKGARLAINPPKERVNLTVRDYESFPDLADAKPYHWPTFAYPGQGSIKIPVPESIQMIALSNALPKVYEAPEQFAHLAANPEAQAQKVVAALKAILTYQPEVLRQRLFTEFECVVEKTTMHSESVKTTMPFNYTSLDPDLRKKYEHVFPQLCNEKTDKEAFIDFIMTLYQMHYDNLYRVVVFYMGCTNNGFGVPLLSTNEELYRKPSIYQVIKAWVEKQNKAEYADDLECQYRLDELEQRYHQVWRDAYALRLRALLKSARDLTQELVTIATKSGSIDELQVKEVTDDSLTDAWQLLGDLKEILIDDEKLCVDNDSKLNQALNSLIQFTNGFQQLAKTYYEKKCSDLQESDNTSFNKGLQRLCLTYDEAILKPLFAHTTSYADKFSCIVRELKKFADEVNFTQHLRSSDEQMAKIAASSKKDLPSLTDPDVISAFNEALFRWVDSISVEAFNQHIEEIIDEKYTKVFSLTRSRAQPVKDYLQKSSESNHNKLAYILSSGKEEGALNTCIIRELTPIMLQMNYIPSVISAVRDGDFEKNINLFTKAAVSYAKNSEIFVHLYHQQGISLFYKTLYKWVDKVSSSESKRFDLIKKAALQQYKSWSFWQCRETEINKYFKDHKVSQALALTFMNGSSSSTASKNLLLCIIREIQRDIAADPKLRNESGYTLIDVFNAEEHTSFYLQHSKDKPTINEAYAIEKDSLITLETI